MSEIAIAPSPTADATRLVQVACDEDARLARFQRCMSSADALVSVACDESTRSPLEEESE